MRYFMWVAVLALSVLTLPVLAGDPDHAFSIPDTEGVIDQEATATVSIDINGEAISGWQLSVCHETSFVELTDVVSLDLGEPDFEALVSSESSWYVGAVVDLTGGGATVETGGDAYEAHYLLIELDCSELVFCTDGLNDDGLIVVADGVVTDVDEFNSGEICAISNFTFQIEEAVGEYDPDVLSLPDLEVPLSICDVAETPDNTLGFNMSLTYDGDVMTITDAQPSGALEALNLGTGPDHFEADFDPEGESGLTISVLYALVADEVLAFDEDCDEVAVLAFERVDDEVIFGGEPIETVIEFEDGLGDPAIDNLIAADGDVEPNLTDGTITWILLEDKFTRGDVDGNGVLFAIIDALFLLEYGFTAGPEPPCQDAADVDDDGTVFPIIDALCVLGFGFLGDCDIPAPTSPDCDVDPTDDRIGCETETCE